MTANAAARRASYSASLTVTRTGSGSRDRPASITVILSPRCRLTVVPPAFASKAARSRSAPLRLLTRSFPTTSSDGRASPGAGGMGADTVPTGLSLRGAGAAATSCLAFPFFGFGDGVSIRSGLPGSGFSTRLTRVSRAGGAGAGARRGVTGSGGGAELFVRAGGAVTLAGIFGVGRSGARGAGGGCSAGGGGTTVTGAVTGGISGRVAGSVEAMRVGGVASPLEGAEGTQRRTARSRSEERRVGKQCRYRWW